MVSIWGSVISSPFVALSHNQNFALSFFNCHETPFRCFCFQRRKGRKKVLKKHVFVFKNETLHDVNNPCEMAMQINLSYWQTRQLPMQIKAKIETELCFLSFYNLHNVMQKQTQITICKNEEKQSENMEGKKTTTKKNNQRHFMGEVRRKRSGNCCM